MNFISEFKQGLSRLNAERPAWLLSLIILAAALLWPAIYVTITGSTFTGLYEESLGYRYFYSLRAVYEPDEFLYLPQGHLITLSHQLLQLTLDQFFPATQLLPRIDVFARIAVLMAHAVTIAAFGWAVYPKVFDNTRIALAVIWGLSYYVSAWSAHYVLLSPDYHAWLPAIGLLFLGLTSRVAVDAGALPGTRYWQLSLIGGLALAVKMSLGVYCIVVGLFMLLAEKRPIRGTLIMGITAVATLLVAALIMILGYGGRIGHLRAYFGDTAYFLNTSEQTGGILTAEQWRQFFNVPGLWENLLLFALPFALVALMVSTKGRVQKVFALSGVIGAIIYAYIVYRRFTDVTQFEAAVFMFYVTSIVIAWFGLRSTTFRRMMVIGVIGGLVVSGAEHVLVTKRLAISKLINDMSINDQAQKRLFQLVPFSKGPVAFLVPNNEYRIQSLETALYKGATKIFSDQISSKLMREFMKNRSYFYSKPGYADNPPDLLPFDTLVFTILQSPGVNNYLDYYVRRIGERIRELEQVYHVSLDAFSCTDWVDFGETSSSRLAVVCRQKTVVASDIRESLPWATKSEGRWVNSEEVLQLQIGMLSKTSADGVRVRVAGQPGDQLKLSGVGQWDAQQKTLGGLVATFGKNGWHVDLSGWPPVNQNYGLEKDASSGLPGFWISPGDAEVQIQQMQDGTGNFVRITALKAAPYLVVNGSLASQDDGMPMSILASVRLPVRKEVRFAIHDVIDRHGAHESKVLVANPDSGKWITGVIRKEAVRFPNPGDNYAVGLSEVKPGDYFDIRFIGTYVGVIP